MKAERWKLLLAVGGMAAGLFAAREAGAWGTPHYEITRHALLALPASDRLDTRLGGDRELVDLAWGGDYQGQVHARYYVNDYLVFPGFPRQSSHVLPQVAETWQPFFHRTLQALRGESPHNAARWLGTFLHFVEDTGSPPHALPTSGVLHTRMENYVTPLALRIPGYQPKLLADNDQAAAVVLKRRLEDLVAYSKERAQKLLPLAEKDDRRACEPLATECAQETMRVVADVAHTLMVLSERGAAADSNVIRGQITGPVMPEFPLAPTKIMVEGTSISTIADAGASLSGDEEYQASYVLGNLPPGRYKLIFMRTGCDTVRKEISLGKKERIRMDVDFTRDSEYGNLVRNPDLKVRWAVPEAPDHWTRAGDEWRSDPFAVVPGENYEFGARDGKGKRVVELRLSDDARMPSGATALKLEGLKTVLMTTRYAQLVVKGEAPPTYAYARPRDPGKSK